MVLRHFYDFGWFAKSSEFKNKWKKGVLHQVWFHYAGKINSENEMLISTSMFYSLPPISTIIESLALTSFLHSQHTLVSMEG